MLYREMESTGEKLSILGYGCMRFPQKNGRIDEEQAEKLIISAIERGVNYFDTAYIYHGGRSESFLGRVLAKGYRAKVNIATKLPVYLVHSRKDMDSILDVQLKRLNTDHIDYYLMHALQDMESWERLKGLGVADFLQKAKETGRIRHIGFSYHGNINNFKKIVDDYPWEFCQIQYNYLDINNQAGREGLKYAASKKLGVVVMEPLRGGNLVGKIPPEVKKVWENAVVKRTPAEWALRWVWNHPEVTVVLSGMSEQKQIDDNISYASEAYPGSLAKEELELVDKARDIYSRMLKVGCTGCRYCVPCPAGVDIPLCFSLYNNKYLFGGKNVKLMYLTQTSGANGKESHAALCMDCGKCEKVCPQHIQIRSRLKDVTRELRIPMTKTLVSLAKIASKSAGIFRR